MPCFFPHYHKDAWQVYAVSSASSVFYKILCLSLPVTWVHNLWQGGPWVVFLLLRFSLFHNQAWQRNMPWEVLKVFHWLILSSSTWPLIGLPWLLASVRTFPLLTNLTAQTVRPIRRTKIWSPKTNICHGKGCPFWYSCVYNKSNVCACVHWFTYNEVCPGRPDHLTQSNGSLVHGSDETSRGLVLLSWKLGAINTKR